MWELASKYLTFNDYLTLLKYKKMKRFNFYAVTILLVAFVSVSLVSCGDDEDENYNGGSSSTSISLVGKTFKKSETTYNDDGEKSVDKEEITFTTSSSCTVHYWGSWENIYNDGHKETYRYDTGTMNATYTISGNKVNIKVASDWGYDREITISDGKLVGYTES